MKKWATILKAIDARSGKIKTYDGENIEAPTWELAQQWCYENAGYLKVVGELIAEVPCKENSLEPDWEAMIDYEKINQN